MIDAFAHFIADFHARAAVAGTHEEYGAPLQVWQPMAENFAQIRERMDGADQLASLVEVERWSHSAFKELEPVLVRRKEDGFVRECHGDMHLRNLAWIDESPVAFDGIEFNPRLRWIDVISEVAFLVMDLQARGESMQAQRFLNGYLEQTGDYAGLRLLPLYLVYRAMVRAKVSAIRLVQSEDGGDERHELEAEFTHYLALARSYTCPAAPRLLITWGVSGSGKSSLSQSLLEFLPAIRVRSDVERKRLYGMAPLESGQAAHAEGIYSEAATVRTYERLRELACVVLEAGYTVIVDATFLHRVQREPFERLAQDKGVVYVILAFHAGEQSLRQRILRRRGDASDADLAVLEHQLNVLAPLSAGEQECCIKIDTESPFDPAALAQRIKGVTRSGFGS